MFQRHISRMAAIIVLVICGAGRAVVIQPTDAQSHDVFLYQGTPTFNYNGAGGFGAFLGDGDSNGGGHNAESVIRFDVSGQTIPANGKVFLGLFVTTSPGIPSVDPSASLTTLTDVLTAKETWDENTATWNNTRSLSSGAGSPVAQTTIGATGQYYTFDVTTAVAGWIADSSTNFGFLVRADAPFANGLGAVFFESAGGDNRPFLNIVPEPATLLAFAPLAFMIRRRRR